MSYKIIEQTDQGKLIETEIDGKKHRTFAVCQRDNMEDAHKDTLDTFLFIKNALADKSVECIVWEPDLHTKFKTIREECNIDDGHWGLEGHADMAKYIINEFK